LQVSSLTRNPQPETEAVFLNFKEMAACLTMWA
jgi:hypothetical protein